MTVTTTESEYWTSPLGQRYASKAMLTLWGSPLRYGLWRRLWVALAETQRELGLDIPDAAIREMNAQVDNIDFDTIRCAAALTYCMQRVIRS